MTIKIERKIVSYRVNEDKQTDAQGGAEERELADVIQMHETLQRPEMLIGSTYKLKVPEHVSPHAMYITINDIILNEGTEHESRRPFEVFINTKNLDHFQWIVALTVIMSAVFRKGGDITFLVDELRSVFDPRGGYWVKGSYKQSIIAEIGDVIERHLIRIGMINPPELDESKKELIRQKREQLAQKEASVALAKEEDAQAAQASAEAKTDDGFPPDARLCDKCRHRAAILMDGCLTCLNCGDSKCG